MNVRAMATDICSDFDAPAANYCLLWARFRPQHRTQITQRLPHGQLGLFSVETTL